MPTQYVERGGEQVFCPPFIAKGVEFYGFVLKADAARMQETICDRYLNTLTGGATEFRPAGSYAVLAFCNLPFLGCTDPPDSNKGWFAEQEAAFWILTVDRRRERFVWFHPYIFVDSSYAMAMGREIYGFPKSLGRFQIPTDPGNADHFAMDTLALRTFSPETEGTWQRLLEVHQIEQDSPEPSVAPWTTFEEMMADAVGRLEGQDAAITDVRLAFDTADDLIHGRVPMVFLKQFRDVANPALASYQSIVEVPSKMVGFHGGRRLPGAHAVTVNAFQSHPVRDDLGLTADTMTPVFSFWVSFDFEIGEGVEVWRAPSP